MTLEFATKFPKGTGELTGKPTYFPQKIIKSLDLPEYKLMTKLDFLNEALESNEILPITDFQELKPKLHTMRHDTENRWEIGDKIHFQINSNTKNMYQFAPVLEVKSIQKISIKYSGFGMIDVIIDDKGLSYKEKKQLAINDGFKTIADFFEYFKEDYEGKIIHWTDLKY